ncbi:hypothetical protein H9623_02820 [Oerskovia sp. Sa1BUA8]|uniref:Uncharacterized protein n=1 Tax=Oerskovia douganii TaxID=2762210 RepID=A0A9D5U7L2_9CELL|nr:hypothetical protein [Oerskovia douganii]MBE7699239.1 hypothetical protein [Oerskovia douganii]
MKTTPSRPETTDEHGTTHRYGCYMPGWTSKPASLRGWHLLTCPTCGAVRLVRAGRGTA